MRGLSLITPHENVMSYVGFKRHGQLAKPDNPTRTVAYIVMDYMKGGQLFNYVEAGAMSAPVARFFFL